MNVYTKVSHSLSPIYDKNSKILILGTMPSVKSREDRFYYSHPQNRFWQVLSCIAQSKLPETIIEKTNLLLNNHIAIWDVLKSCDIIGSDDNTIKNPVINDFTFILDNSKISKVFTNGKKADTIYSKYCISVTNIESVCLPSTSPANAAWSLDRLIDYWKESLNL